MVDHKDKSCYNLKRAKNYKGFAMERRALKEMMYGSIEELMQNSRYYYYSSIGAQFSHWTDEGKKALAA